MKPLITLKRTRKKDNVYGYKVIEVLKLNYDGEGNAIVRYDRKPDLEYMAGGDLSRVLFGDPHDGTRWYRATRR